VTGDAGTSFGSAFAAARAARLPAFLLGQRWFPGKARGLATVAIDDVAVLPRRTEDAPPCALVVARATFTDGGEERYTLLIAAVGSDDDSDRIVDERDWPGSGGLVEACPIEACGRALLAGFSTGSGLPTRAGGALVHGDRSSPGAFERTPLDTCSVHPLGAEQSNTSLRVGGGLVFKLFRRFEPGENPEVEIGRFLHRTGFRSMPVLHGSLSLDRDGTRHTVGVLQSFVANEGDGWRWTLERLSEGQGAPAEAMRGLGEITAAFHIAIASDPAEPGFAPKAASAANCAAWTGGVRVRLERTLELLARMKTRLPDAVRPLAARVLAERPMLERLASAPDLAFGGFDLIRIHGDFHLGQTLRVADGFMLMDFEGEPARSLAERRAPSAALRDVAGMLRSFGYAVVAAGIEDPRTERALRDAYLAGYDARAGAAPFLPAGAEARAAWIAFFELEKALYEIEYEINNRPDWLSIPLRGILRVLGQEA
jgi:trehalose synthase-fused probable maltokinase